MEQLTKDKSVTEHKDLDSSATRDEPISCESKENNARDKPEIVVSDPDAELKKPVYRTLVQRKSVFDGMMNMSEEGQSDPEDEGNNRILKCGYCSATFSDMNLIISHLFTHEKRSQKILRKQNRVVKLKSPVIKEKSFSHNLIAASSGQECKRITRSRHSLRSDYYPKYREFPEEITCNDVLNNKLSHTQTVFKTRHELKKENTDSSNSIQAAISTVRRKLRQSQSGKNLDTPRHSMLSVGTRNAKKKLGDDFITSEPKRKKRMPLRCSAISSNKRVGRTKHSCLEINSKTIPLKAEELDQATNIKLGINLASTEFGEDAPNFSKTNQTYKAKQKAISAGVNSLINCCKDSPSRCASNFLMPEDSAPNTTVTHEVRKASSETLFQCATCKGCFLWKWPFLNHLKIHPNEKPFECLTCKKKLFSFFGYVSHVKYFHNPKRQRKCFKCVSTFPSQYLLKLHMNSHKSHCPSVVSCKICNKTFSFKRLLSHHISKVHSESMKKFQGSIKCKPCGKTFRDRRNLWVHQKRHPNAVKPFKCQFCPRRFAMQKWLADHVQRHTPVRNYPCGVCGKCYFTKSDATMHERRHTKEATFMCNKCDRKFIYKSELNAHLRRHQGIRLPKNIICDVCSKSFATRRDLDRHMTVHTGEKPYKCPVCAKSFSQEINMQVHMRIHSGERPYQCEICEKRFIAKSKLTRHRLCHSTPKGMLARPYKCVLCPRKYTVENSLIRHLRTHKDSPQTITNITAALNKVAEEPGASESSLTAGALLASMIDQAISDAKRVARHRKKRAKPGNPSLAEMIDQAIHNSKTSCSTQTPIVIDDTYVSVQLTSPTVAENAVTTIEAEGEVTVKDGSGVQRGGTPSSGPELLKLFSNTLIKYNESDQELYTNNLKTHLHSSSHETFFTQTIIVDPKGDVMNARPPVRDQEIIRLTTLQMAQPDALRCAQDCTSSDQTASCDQDAQISTSDDVQQIYVHTLSCSNGSTTLSQDKILVTPIPESLSGEQYAAVSNSVPGQFILHSLLQPSGSNGNQESVVSVSSSNGLEIIPSCADKPLKARDSCGTFYQMQQIFPSSTAENITKAGLSFLAPTCDLKNESNFVVPSLYPGTNKLRHVILKTAGGQTFLIPSTQISLNPSSHLLMAPISAIMSDNSESCTESFDQIIKYNQS